MEHKGLIAWFTKNTVAANLLAAAIVVGGLITLPGIRKEVFPEINPAMITVSVIYLGATPEEVEEAICSRIEEAVDGLDGVKEVTSSANEGAGAVSIELLTEADQQKALDDVRTRVDAITTFPENTEKPIVQRLEQRRQVINVAVSGNIDERSLKEIGERVREDLLDLPGLTQVELTNVRPYEISIDVSEHQLRRHGLTFNRVADAVRRSSLDLPAGSIKTSGGEILLRTKGQAYWGEEFENLVLMTRPDGSRVMLGDVADVVDGFADTDLEARFDGIPSALIKVFRVGNQSALDIASSVRSYIDAEQSSLPAGVSMTAWQDDTVVLRGRLDLLLRNGFSGLLLVILVLALFMQLRVAFWVTLGIPISFLGAVALMPFFDISINVISLFAFIVVLGIVVDDAIVVGENIYKHQQKKEDSLLASIVGSKEVSVPVVFAVLTTVASFMPMFNVPGADAQIWKVIPLIVIPTLLFSLLESKLILPAHLTFVSLTKREPGRWSFISRAWTSFQGLFSGSLEWFVERIYKPWLETFMRWRYLTIATGFAFLLVTVGLAAGGWVKFIYFPGVEGDNVVARVTLPPGTPITVTRDVVARMEQAAKDVSAELSAEFGMLDQPIAEHMFSTVGGQPFLLEQQRMAGDREALLVSGGHTGEVNVQLLPAETRSVGSEEFQRRWRDRVGLIPDVVELGFSSQMFTLGKDVDVQLKHRDSASLERAASELKIVLAGYDGVMDVTDSFRGGKEEIKLSIKPSAEMLGLSTQDLARQVRQAFYGEEAQRVQRGRDDVKVMVRYPESKRRSLADLENLRIRTRDGGEVPFYEVAEAEFGRGFSTIRRADRSRIVRVSAEIDENNPQASAGRVNGDLRDRILPAMTARYPGLSFSFEGDQKQQAETMEGLIVGFAFALFLIYALMAIPFKSYLQPLIIMSAIPFGLVGAVWGHLFMGIELSIMSMFGIIALAGVVVNDSLVLVDFINRRREEHADILTAIREAASHRFRPILLTSLTTFASLTPLMLEKSVQASFLIPMAVSLAFGVLFATGIILVIVPCIYLVLEDVRGSFAWLYGRQQRKLVESQA